MVSGSKGEMQQISISLNRLFLFIKFGVQRWKLLWPLSLKVNTKKSVLDLASKCTRKHCVSYQIASLLRVGKELDSASECSPLVFGNDVDSVDVAARTAMVICELMDVLSLCVMASLG